MPQDLLCAQTHPKLQHKKLAAALSLNVLNLECGSQGLHLRTRVAQHKYAPHLDGQYTVVGKVISGMEVVDAIKKGDQAMNGSVDAPDYMAKVTVAE